MNQYSLRDDDDILECFETCYSESEDYFSEVRSNTLEDTKFSLGDMWPKDIKEQRESHLNKRPCVVVNKIEPLVYRIVNGAKQQSLGIRVKPVDGVADIKTANALSGLIRNIEYVSNAKLAYMWAYECAVRGGVGYFRIDEQYVSDDSFDMMPFINRIRDPWSVFWDPQSQTQDGSDARWCLIVNQISKAEAAEYGIDERDALSTSKKKFWTRDESILIGEMFWTEYIEDTLIELDSGELILLSQITEDNKPMLSVPGMVVRKRKIKVKIIKWAKTCQNKVLEKTTVNGKYIPIVPVYGRESYIEGKVDYKGITRNSKDSNRMYNYMSSLQVERIALAPRVSFIAAAGQIEDFEEDWKLANTQNIPVLQYTPVSLNGSIVPPPQRSESISADPSIERYMVIAQNDIKETSSIADSYLGRPGNEVSGKAIEARVSQGDTSTFDFLDNVVIGIKQGGKIILDKLPRIITGPRAARILGADGEEELIWLNKQYSEEKTGKRKFFDIQSGVYDVEVDVGTGDKTRRERAVETLSVILNTNPQAGNLIMDLLVKNMDIKDADKVSKRFRTLLPPQVIAAEEGENPDNPDLNALQTQAEQIITQLKQELTIMQQKMVDLEIAQKNKEGELAIKQQEVDIKKDELTLKKAESVSTNEDPGHAAVMQQLVGEMQNQKKEIEMIEQQLEMIVTALQKLFGGQSPAPQGNGPSGPQPGGVQPQPGDGTQPEVEEQPGASQGSLENTNA